MSFNKSQLGKIKLEDGCKYVDGTGEVVTVNLVGNKDDQYPFQGDNFHVYMSDGRYVPESEDDMSVSAFGLVKKV